MKEVFSAFGSEVYRPLVTMVLPGAIGALPLFVWCLDHSEPLRGYASGHATETTVLGLLGTLFLGLLFEEVGPSFKAVDRGDLPGSAATGEERIAKSSDAI